MTEIDIRIRQGGPADAPAVLALLDDAVRWLVAHGRSGQWGTQPWSERQAAADRITTIVSTDDVWMAEVDGHPAGAMTLSPRCHDYVPAADVPELYVTLLVTARRLAGNGIGSALLAHAREEVARLDVHQLRVDCYAGSEGTWWSTTAATVSHRSRPLRSASGRDNC